MVHNLNISVVVENTAGQFDLLGEWGLALWIEAGNRKILFDSGQGRALIENARSMGIDPATADLFVLSHGHHDHSGGIAALFAAGYHGMIYAHPAAFARKYSKSGNAPIKDAGISANALRALHKIHAHTIDCTSPVELAPGILLTGTVPRCTSCEDTGGDFFVDADGTERDQLIDDQALLIETQEGWVVITGCGHSGIVNTLQYAASLVGTKNIRAVIGGLHLYRATQERIQKTIEALRDFNVQILAPCHCTGFDAATHLRNEFGDRFKSISAGTRLSL
jgi:7,8-dihydropterin-6-yl-methyl-4-(beta-D-ribofuranosyl)aminobenzene 5'-phosphate synthase